MKYQQRYLNLITYYKNREAIGLLPNQPLHRHHIIPRSRNGDDHQDNLVTVSVREHAHLHMLLAQLDGFEDQVFAVQALFDSARHPRSRSYGALDRGVFTPRQGSNASGLQPVQSTLQARRLPRWCRRRAAFRSAAKQRAMAKLQAMNEYAYRYRAIEQSYVNRLLEIADGFA